MDITIKETAIEIVIFFAASALSWVAGRKLVPLFWNCIVKRYGAPVGLPTKLGPAVGGLEGILYVFAVMSDKYDLITGWFVMKAFFGWIIVRPGAGQEKAAPGHDALNLFNEYLIGNLLSLFAGLSCGLGARLCLKLMGIE